MTPSIIYYTIKIFYIPVNTKSTSIVVDFKVVNYIVKVLSAMANGTVIGNTTTTMEEHLPKVPTSMGRRKVDG